MKEALRQLIYPARCFLCGEVLPWPNAEALCSRCRPDRFVPALPRCVSCSRPIAEGSFCGECLEKRPQVPGRGTFLYEGAIRESIQAYKYSGAKHYASAYAAEMIRHDGAYFGPMLRGGAVLAPIPIHRARLRERGYNQAELLARALEERLPAFMREAVREEGGASGSVLYPKVWPGLVRTGKTAVLHGLSAEARRQELAKAFQLDEDKPLPRLPAGNYKKEDPRRGEKQNREGGLPTVIIIDDIYTSGSTVEAAGEVIRERYPDAVIRFWTLSLRA